MAQEHIHVYMPIFIAKRFSIIRHSYWILCKSWKAYSSRARIFSKCILCDSEYLICLDVHLLQIKISKLQM
jgi:hypothetical protein